jgi:hypothetical protein
MRTTVNIDEHLLEAAKDLARARGETVSSVLEDGIRRMLTESAREPVPFNLPVVGEGGPMPGVDLCRLGEFLEDEDELYPLDQRR